MTQNPSSGTLFPMSNLPEGFVYQPDFLSEQEEAELLAAIRSLDFREFDFHGYTARRRVVEYGLAYDFSTRKATATKPFPDFLVGVKARAAEFAGLAASALAEGIVLEYPAGAPIGWHRDAPQFGSIVGISLANSATMRLKPYVSPKSKSETVSRSKPLSILLEPRSIYVMRGPARWGYQHSIPAVAELRYSITFRTLRGKEQASDAA
jgi:alkylated DNA repair dioxygenase AlkB